MLFPFQQLHCNKLDLTFYGYILLGPLTEVAPIQHWRKQPSRGPTKRQQWRYIVFCGEIPHTPSSPNRPGTELNTKSFSSPILNSASHYPRIWKRTRIITKQHLQQLDQTPVAAVHKWCIAVLYTWNLYNLMNQHHPNTFNNKKFKHENK